MYNRFTSKKNTGRQTAPLPVCHDFYKECSSPTDYRRHDHNGSPRTRRSFCIYCIDFMIKIDDLKVENNRLKNRLMGQIYEQENELLKMKWQVKVTKAKNESLEKNLRLVNHDLRIAQRKNDRLQADLQRREESFNALFDSYQAVISENSKLKSALAHKENSIVFAAAYKKDEIENLKRDLHWALGRLKTVGEDLKQARCKITEKEENLMKLKKTEEEKRKLQKDIEELKSELQLERRKSRYNHLGKSQNNETDVTGHSQWITRFTALQNEQQELLTRISTMEEENRKYRTLLKHNQNALEKIEIEKSKLKSENEELRNKLQEKSYSSGFLLEDSTKNKNFQTEMKNIREENQSYQQKISTLKIENGNALGQYERAERRIQSLEAEVQEKQSEIERLQERVKQGREINNKLQQELSENSKERKNELKREEVLTRENQLLRDNLNQLQTDDWKHQEESIRVTSKIYGETEKQINDIRTEMHQAQKRITQLESENDRLKDRIDTISLEKDNALTRKDNIEAELNNLKLEVRQKLKEIQELQRHNLQREEETKKLQKELSEILKGRDTSLKRNNRFEQENQRLQENLNKLQVENELLQEKLKSTTKIIEEMKQQQRSMIKETGRLQERVAQLATENNQLREDITEVSKEKDNALTRLSKVAGAKLTHGNAAITDLSDTNRPTKIAEKFSELYDNQWTDAFEELDNTYNNEEETIQVLLKILQEAYNFCVQTETNYETRIGQAVFTLADEKTNEFRQINETDVPVQKALTDLRLSLGNACCLIMEEMFLARLPSILKMVDVSVSPKTKLYARQCASLCWRMRIRDPPVFVRFEFRRGTEFNTDILRRYTKTGGYLDFIVWPALYLHENGPVLSKGVAQPKHSP